MISWLTPLLVVRDLCRFSLRQGQDIRMDAIIIVKLYQPQVRPPGGAMVAPNEYITYRI